MGCGPPRICDLEWSQVEFSRSASLHVRRVKNGKPSVHPREEIRALRELRRQFPDSGFVFPTERGGPFTPDAGNRQLKRIGERAGFVFPVHCHMLRHGCGYALANAGHDTRAIQDWLGHRSIQPVHGEGPDQESCSGAGGVRLKRVENRASKKIVARVRARPAMRRASAASRLRANSSVDPNAVRREIDALRLVAQEVAILVGPEVLQSRETHGINGIIARFECPKYGRGIGTVLT
jgi:hypothetical protein